MLKQNFSPGRDKLMKAFGSSQSAIRHKQPAIVGQTQIVVDSGKGIASILPLDASGGLRRRSRGWLRRLTSAGGGRLAC